MAGAPEMKQQPRRTSSGVDAFTREERSEIMSRVKSTNTKPELRVRSALHRMGYRFRLHRKDLPGNPDLVLPKHRTVVFVHGCFWHQHPGCRKATIPQNNREYWERKLGRNVERDRRSERELETLGWRVVKLWECEMPGEDGALRESLGRALARSEAPPAKPGG